MIGGRVLLSLGLVSGLLLPPASAESLRIALWNIELERRGPGLLLRDILSGKDAQVEASLAVIAALKADVLLLAGFDYDHDLLAAKAFARRLTESGTSYPHLFSRRSNRGLPTGLDLDGDGRRGTARDAQGYGHFSGQSALLLLSNRRIDEAGLRDFSTLLWRDLPNALLPDDMTAEARDLQRLSTTGHYELPLLLENGRDLRLLFWHATPPVFDGPEDRNGRRNHDETAFWLALLGGRLTVPPPEPPFLILGTANLDPEDGDGRREAIRSLLSHPDLLDSLPKWPEAPPEPAHRGDPQLDTALLSEIGGLRLEVMLTSQDIPLRRSGILRADPESPFGQTLARASRHFPIWLEIDLPLKDRP